MLTFTQKAGSFNSYIFRRSFGQSYRNLLTFCSLRWGAKVCPNNPCHGYLRWPMVTWGVTKM